MCTLGTSYKVHNFCAGESVWACAFVLQFLATQAWFLHCYKCSLLYPQSGYIRETGCEKEHKLQKGTNIPFCNHSQVRLELVSFCVGVAVKLTMYQHKVDMDVLNTVKE